MAKKIVTRFKPPTRPNFFKSWRKHRGYTLEAAAELSGMSIGNISAMERGTQNYTQSGLEALAEAYNSTPGQLLTVDPQNSDIWSIWESAKPAERQMIVSIAKTVTKTGT